MNTSVKQDDHEPSGLKQKATEAFIWDMAGTIAKQGVGFVISIFLARLLLPEEFGLVAMALVFITISQTVSDFGLASALIQKKDATSVTYSSVFYFNLVVGIFLFVLFWFAAPFVADFYETPSIGPMVRWLSLNFIIGSLNQVQQTILRKQIDFKKIAIRSSIAQLMSGLVGIGMAYRGMGVYALVAQNLLGSAIGTAMLWQVSGWRPSWEFSMVEMRKLSGFSVYVFLSYVTGKITTQIDTLIVGKLFNATTLGYYSRAASLNSLVTTFSSSSISKIAFSLLSHLQDNREKFVRTYLILLELVAFVSFGLSGVLVLAGSDLISVLFGTNWAPAILIFQILVLKSFTYPVSLLINSVFWAGGKSKDSFWFGNISKIVALLPLGVALYWGFQPFLYAVVAASLLNWLLTNWFVASSFKISFLNQSKSIVIYAAIFLLIGAPLYFLSNTGLVSFPFVGTCMGAAFAVMYFAVNALIKTRGFVYALDNLKPIWNKLTKK